MFQVFLIIFWATIRLQNWGEAVCDPSVGAADSSPQGEPRAVACGAVLFASPAKGRRGRRAAHGSVGSRFFDVSSNPSGSQANHLPLTGEAMTVPLDRGGDPSVSGADSSPWQGRRPLSRRSRQLPLAGEPMAVYLAGEPMTQLMRLFTAASIYSHTPRKFLFTSLFGMRRTVKP